jgi:hypothetical protein
VDEVLILDPLEVINVIVRPILESALLSQRNKLIVRREIELGMFEPYNYNLLVGGPKLVQQEAERA